MQAQKGTILKCLYFTLLLLAALLFAPPVYLASAQLPPKPPQQIAYLEPDPIAADKLYQDWLDQKRNKLPNYDPCSCVSYAKYKSGINVGSIGRALNHPINSQTPAIGAILIEKISSRGFVNTGHLAVVTAISANSITVSEANYKHCQVSSRIIPLADNSILGYYVLQ